MLSYQHIYHAGCPADVHKHSALAAILDEMIRNSKTPFTYMDTHGGRGLYDLRAPEARKTGEACGGVMQIAGKDVPEEMLPYLRAITRHKGKYPGSLMIAADHLRPDDRLHVCELHPQEYEALKANTDHDRRINIYNRDGYETIRMCAADMDRQPGLVLIDPSYEIKEEYEQAASFISIIHSLWPQAVIMLWAPLLAAGRHEKSLQALEKKFSSRLWRQDVVFAEKGSVRGMYGSALAVLNLPHHLAASLSVCGEWCAQHCRVT